MDILKNTQGLCAHCKGKIPSIVYEKDNQIYMDKNCSKHGKTTVLLEKDVFTYKALMNKKNKKRKIFESFMIAIDHGCNMHCAYCWLPQRKRDDISLKEFEKQVSSFEGQFIRLSGGEPTLRKDIFEMIRICRKYNKISVLVTNGILLADKEYVKKLYEAGLGSVALTINTLNINTYKILNSEDKTFEPKIKAFENLKELGKIPVSLCITLTKGVNEPEIDQLLDFYLENLKTFDAMRLRSSSDAGRILHDKKLYLSELLKMFAKKYGCNYKVLIKENSEADMPCSFNTHTYFYVEDNKPVFLMANKIGFPTPNHAFYLNLMKRIGTIKTLKYLYKIKSGKGIMRQSKLGLRSHPDRHTIEYNEIDRCPHSHLTMDGEKMPLCQAGIYNNIGMVEL
ncbi:MAG: radical SAM protein [Candidatus Nanoarchaeia archaeon]